MKAAATISPCGAYRYCLTRRWDADGAALVFVMLNPSTADALQDDPTIRKCIGFARRAGFGAIGVVNLFAYRATKPADLKAAGWPCGPDNEAFVLNAAISAHATGGKVVLAWGANARGRGEGDALRDQLRCLGITAHALRVLEDGTPAHPLMLPYSCALQVLP